MDTALCAGAYEGGKDSCQVCSSLYFFINMEYEYAVNKWHTASWITRNETICLHTMRNRVDLSTSIFLKLAYEMGYLFWQFYEHSYKLPFDIILSLIVTAKQNDHSMN